MFSHIYAYSLKQLFRNKVTLIWSLIFPMVLGTFFHLAFAKVMDSEVFEKIPVAVVAADGDSSFMEQADLFKVTIATEEEARELLKDDKIKGYILADEDNKMVVKESSYEQNVLRVYLETYEQTVAAVQDIIEETQGRVTPEQIIEVMQGESNLKEKESDLAFPNLVTNYYFALMAMAVMYAGFSGIFVVNLAQANQSKYAARMNLSAVSKIKLFFSALAAILTTQIIIINIIYLFLKFVLNVDFGVKYAGIILTNSVAVLTGVLIGVAIGIVIKGKEAIKIASISGGGLLLCYLSGLMDVQMKYKMQESVPFLSKINPANMITDAYYSLYYYDTYDRFWTDIRGLLIVCLICCGIAIIFLRRQKYESI